MLASKEQLQASDYSTVLAKSKIKWQKMSMDTRAIRMIKQAFRLCSLTGMSVKISTYGHVIYIIATRWLGLYIVDAAYVAADNLIPPGLSKQATIFDPNYGQEWSLSYLLGTGANITSNA